MQKIQKDKEKIASMFDEIAQSYDRADHILSMGVDHIWRRKIRKLIQRDFPQQSISILDIATGTADLAIEMAKIEQSKIVGIDIAEQMLAVGKEKVNRKHLQNIELRRADALKIPFSDNSFDVVTVAFGVRNFENLEAGIKEIFRVLKPNGRYYILELTRPIAIFRPFYSIYLYYILPILGFLITQKKTAYVYLKNTIRDFHQDDALDAFFINQGFKNTSFTHLSLGIATIYKGIKIKKEII
ncbi:MAG: bifunctional demethylmenaquinone methyltransferase/2-methoxy-6-polyprenyl-1,4-benzoquinol methylase UbiE [Bacteroidota bacterium]